MCLEVGIGGEVLAKIIPKDDDWLVATKPKPLRKGTRRRLMNRLCRVYVRACATQHGYYNVAKLMQRLRMGLDIG